MLKSFYLATVVIPIATQAALSPVLAQSLYPPEVSGSVADTLVCYMQTSDGRLLQLASFCQGETSTGNGRQSQFQSPNSPNQSFRNGASGNSSQSFDTSRPNNQMNGPSQNDAASSGPSETAVCMPANAPECAGIDFSAAAPDFVPDTSPAPVTQ